MPVGWGAKVIGSAAAGTVNNAGGGAGNNYVGGLKNKRTWSDTDIARRAGRDDHGSSWLQPWSKITVDARAQTARIASQSCHRASRWLYSDRTVPSRRGLQLTQDFGEVRTEVGRNVIGIP